PSWSAGRWRSRPTRPCTGRSSTSRGPSRSRAASRRRGKRRKRRCASTCARRTFRDRAQASGSRRAPAAEGARRAVRPGPRGCSPSATRSGPRRIGGDLKARNRGVENARNWKPAENLPLAVEALRGAGRVLLTMHRGPDGDALGSALALACALREMGREVVVYNPDELPYNFRFLRGADSVARTIDQEASF